MNWKIDIDMSGRNTNRKRFYCLLCDEQINNPLCPNCIAEGFKQWIQKFPKKVEKQLRKRTNIFLKNYKILGNNYFKCISCNQLGSPICPDCFTDFLYQICLEEGLSVSDLREFLLIFDFNFRKDQVSNKAYPKLSETH